MSTYQKEELLGKGMPFRPQKVIKGAIYYFFDGAGKRRPHILISDPETYGFNRLHKFFEITSVPGPGRVPFIVTGNKVSYINCFHIEELTAGESVSSNCPSGVVDEELVDALTSIYLGSFGVPVKGSAVKYLLKYAESFNGILAFCQKNPRGPQLVSGSGTLEEVQPLNVKDLLEGLEYESLDESFTTAEEEEAISDPELEEPVTKEEKRDPLEVQLGDYCDEFLSLDYKDSHQLMAMATTIAKKLAVTKEMEETLLYPIVKWGMYVNHFSKKRFSLKDIERAADGELKYYKILEVCKPFAP